MQDIKMYMKQLGIRKNGDALLETSGWHSSGASVWFFYNNGSSGLLRAYSGSLFSFYGYGSHGHDYTNFGYGDAYFPIAWTSRACIVNGPEL